MLYQNVSLRANNARVAARVAASSGGQVERRRAAAKQPRQSSSNVVPLKKQLRRAEAPAREAAPPPSGRAAPAAPAAPAQRAPAAPSYAAPRAGPASTLALVASSAAVLQYAVGLTAAASPSPAWLPAMLGGGLGLAYALVRGVLARSLWRPPAAPLRVVVTGATRGIGKALAREFLRAGDLVFLTSRTPEGARRAVAELLEEVGPEAVVSGAVCDVSDPASVERLAQRAAAFLGGGVDAWVNNAGHSGGFKGFLELEPEEIAQVVRTNMAGTLLCTRAAVRLMRGQPGGGHVFNLDGAGADGGATPLYAAYGATKAGIAEAWAALRDETAPLGVHVHNLSPGMVLTDLLLAGATPASKRAFNILCEHPETAAAFLVPRARSAVAGASSARYVRFLTPLRALGRFALAPLRWNRYFDGQGRPRYLPERERVLGQRAKRTRRLARRAARRGAPLGAAYALSMASAYLLLALGAASGG